MVFSFFKLIEAKVIGCENDKDFARFLTSKTFYALKANKKLILKSFANS